MEERNIEMGAKRRAMAVQTSRTTKLSASNGNICPRTQLSIIESSFPLALGGNQLTVLPTGVI